MSSWCPLCPNLAPHERVGKSWITSRPGFFYPHVLLQRGSDEEVMYGIAKWYEMIWQARFDKSKCSLQDVPFNFPESLNHDTADTVYPTNHFSCRTRQPGVKFIIILDRRLDTWASIKTALARIAVSFQIFFSPKSMMNCIEVHLLLKWWWVTNVLCSSDIMHSATLYFKSITACQLRDWALRMLFY